MDSGLTYTIESDSIQTTNVKNDIVSGTFYIVINSLCTFRNNVKLQVRIGVDKYLEKSKLLSEFYVTGDEKEERVLIHFETKLCYSSTIWLLKYADDNFSICDERYIVLNGDVLKISNLRGEMRLPIYDIIIENKIYGMNLDDNIITGELKYDIYTKYPNEEISIQIRIGNNIDNSELYEEMKLICNNLPMTVISFFKLTKTMYNTIWIMICKSNECKCFDRLSFICHSEVINVIEQSRKINEKDFKQ